MAETPLMFGDVLFQLVRMLVFLIFVIGMAVAFITIFRASELDYAAKAAREVGETLMVSGASDGRGVLVIEELNKYKIGDEPFARHCSYGYKATIKTTDGKQSWEFGMEPQPGMDNALKATEKFPIGLKHAGSEYVEYTGKMEITVHETLLTQLSCVMEMAYETGVRQTMRHTLTNQDAHFAELSDVKSSMLTASSIYYDMRFALKNGKLCAVDGKGEPISICRKINAPFGGFHVKYKYDVKAAGSDTTFAAIPVKEPINAARCSDIPNDVVATTNDEMKTVALCVDDKELEIV